MTTQSQNILIEARSFYRRVTGRRCSMNLVRLCRQEAKEEASEPEPKSNPLTLMSSAFQKSYRHTLNHEGGYADDPVDRGGETYKGIARNHHPEWPGWIRIDDHKARPGFPQSLRDDENLDQMIADFYKEHYWDSISLGQLQHENIAVEMFDIAVNMGTRTAAKMLQEALNLTNRNERDYPELAVDGIIGPITLSRVNGHRRPETVFKVLNGLQAERYLNIVRNDPSQEKFLAGWYNRVRMEPNYES